MRERVDSEEQEKQLSTRSPHQLTSTSPPPESNENSELLALESSVHSRV